MEVIREMDNNVRLDKGYLSVSERRGQSEASLLFFRTADNFFFTAAGHSGGATYLINYDVAMAPRTVTSSPSR